jgi:hypothetical protein
MGYTSRNDAKAEIAARREFKGNSMFGSYGTSYGGHIYGRAAELWAADQIGGQIEYVVVSYATPIAWYTKRGEWVVPQEKYSHTTSRHQSVVRSAVGMPWGAVAATVR